MKRLFASLLAASIPSTGSRVDRTEFGKMIDGARVPKAAFREILIGEMP